MILLIVTSVEIYRKTKIRHLRADYSRFRKTRQGENVRDTDGIITENQLCLSAAVNKKRIIMGLNPSR